MIDFNDINSLKQNGFEGFKTVKELWNDHSDIPKEKGVYLVLDPNNKNPEFINPGVGGFFKDRNPNLPVRVLKEKYITGSQVVYIGKAGGSNSRATLFSRIGQYLRFGQGKKVGHWGGRYIWQLMNYSDLIFCWKTTPEDDPRIIERKLINLFADKHCSFPFANLVA